MALGQNPIVAYMTWDGYNYEDAIILSERLVKEDVYTSVHLEEFESETRDTKFLKTLMKWVSFVLVLKLKKVTSL